MAEKKDKAQEKEGGEGGAGEFKTHQAREKKKSRWDLTTCMKYAKRFDNVEDWAKGAPSCFKAATARGFIAKCTAHMAATGKTMKTAKPAAKTTAAPKKKVGKRTA